MKLLRALLADQSGATVVEYGLLLPVVLGTFMGVLQVGLGAHDYNALRNVVAETSRYALVEYQNNRKIGWNNMEAKGRTFAPKAGLDPTKFTITITKPATQRVDGALELQIVATYQVQSVVPFLGINSFTETYTRPLFLITDVTT